MLPKISLEFFCDYQSRSEPSVKLNEVLRMTWRSASACRHVAEPSTSKWYVFWGFNKIGHIFRIKNQYIMSLVVYIFYKVHIL